MDSTLTDRAGVSPHTLRGLHAVAGISEVSLQKLVRAAEELRLEAEVAALENERWLEELRKFRDKVGGRNKAADLLRVNPTYLGRVLRGEKPMTAEMVKRLRERLLNVT